MILKPETVKEVIREALDRDTYKCGVEIYDEPGQAWYIMVDDYFQINPAKWEEPSPIDPNHMIPWEGYELSIWVETPATRWEPGDVDQVHICNSNLYNVILRMKREMQEMELENFSFWLLHVVDEAERKEIENEISKPD